MNYAIDQKVYSQKGFPRAWSTTDQRDSVSWQPALCNLIKAFDAGEALLQLAVVDCGNCGFGGSRHDSSFMHFIAHEKIFLDERTA